jgi:hypothetical protein
MIYSFELEHKNLTTGSEIMFFSPSTAKTVKAKGKRISYLDSSSKNTLKEFISIIKMRW